MQWNKRCGRDVDIFVVKKKPGRIYETEALLYAALERIGACDAKLRRTDSGAWALESCVEGTVHFSVSHTQHHWVCLIGDEGPLGIDIEEKNRVIRSRIVRALHPLEQQCLSGLSAGSAEFNELFLAIWTRKESYAKYLGRGLGVGMASFSVVDEYGGFCKSIELEKGTRAFLREVSLATSLIAAVCVPDAHVEIVVRELAYAGLPSKAPMEHAADFLAHRDYTALQLKEKLLEKGHDQSAVNAAISKLQEHRYIDDEQYAQRYARLAIGKGKSTQRIARELTTKGIGADKARAIVQQLAETFEQTDFERALEQARLLLQKEGYSEADVIPDQLKGRIARKLSSLGYDAPDIWRTLERLGPEA